MKNPSNKMSREMVLKIKDYLNQGHLFQHQIAAKLGINQGRVSEVKHNHWNHLLNK